MVVRGSRFLIALWVTFALNTASIASESKPIDSSVLIGLEAMAADGTIYPIGESHGNRGIALVFLSNECPISNQYIPELNRIYRDQSDRHVEVYGVLSDRTVTRARAKSFADEFQLAFPLLFDSSGELRRVLQPSHVPQAFVLSPKGKLVYSGRIDDLYHSVGRRRSQATQYDLRNVLESLASDATPDLVTTEPVGCRLEPTDPSEPVTDVTYSRDVAPILFANCVTCHRPGEVAPLFALGLRRRIEARELHRRDRSKSSHAAMDDSRWALPFCRRTKVDRLRDWCVGCVG